MDGRFFDDLARRLSRPISRRGVIRGVGKALLGALVYTAFNQTPSWASRAQRRRRGCACSGDPLPPNGPCDCACNVAWPGPPANDLCTAELAKQGATLGTDARGTCHGTPPGCTGNCRRQIIWKCTARVQDRQTLYEWQAVSGEDTCPNPQQVTDAKGTCRPETDVCRGDCTTSATWVCTGYPIAEQWHEVKRRRTDTCVHIRWNHEK
jgi:hypothetical protein